MTAPLVPPETKAMDPSPATPVELYQLDTTPIHELHDPGGTPLQIYFTPHTTDMSWPQDVYDNPPPEDNEFPIRSWDYQPISWGGQEYQPIPIVVTGFDRDGQGALTRPVVTLSGVDPIIQGLVKSYGDLVGALFWRTVTLDLYLDPPHGYYPDDTLWLYQDRYVVSQKVSQGLDQIELVLRSEIDRDGQKFPGRPVMRDTCGLRYGTWTGTAWDYSLATCPWRHTSGQYWNPIDESTTESGDQCSKRLKGCRARFGSALGQPLPMGAFPGAGPGR